MVIMLSITPAAPTAEGNGTGLKAEIFDNDQLSGSPKVTRTDPTINYAWRHRGSPAENIPSDNFGTRWSGTVEPRYSEKYQFTTVSDDTARVWIDGKLVIDNPSRSCRRASSRRTDRRRACSDCDGVRSGSPKSGRTPAMWKPPAPAHRATRTKEPLGTVATRSSEVTVR
ncbi:PA14 domain-containing protein [Streptomyces sp. NPDC086554]|uniref:PA14 domain-containing protein n=1 Tax=Streptomyces sp. NPDC086554 TaxID=3154864 RepID=UPI0034296443